MPLICNQPILSLHPLNHLRICLTQTGQYFPCLSHSRVRSQAPREYPFSLKAPALVTAQAAPPGLSCRARWRLWPRQLPCSFLPPDQPLSPVALPSGIPCAPLWILEHNNFLLFSPCSRVLLWPH